MVTNEVAGNLESDTGADTLELHRSGPGEVPTRTEQMIYRKCMIDGWPQEEYELLFGVGSMEIAQICRKVAEWRVSILPRSKLSLDDQQVMVDQVTVERLEHLYAQAMDAWRESRKDQSLTKRAIIGAFEGTVAIRSGVGHAALLAAAAKIVIALGKYQTQCVERRAKALAQLERHEQIPPVRACSLSGSEQKRSIEALSGNGGVKDYRITSSGESHPEGIPITPTHSHSLETVQVHGEGGGRGGPENGPPPGRPKPR